MAYTQEIIDQAKHLYLQRYTPREIRERLNLASARIVYYWATKFEWYARLDRDSVEDIITQRINVLAYREHKTAEERDELDRLIDHHVKILAARFAHTEKITAMKTLPADPDEQYQPESFIDKPAGKKRSSGKNNKRVKNNDVSKITREMLDKLSDNLYEFQKTLQKNSHKRRRNILKSRQIGATWYFSFEAFQDAVLTGDSQIFISASKRQSLVFRTYMSRIALEFFGVNLKGDPIRLSNLAEIHFLATNSNTTQSHSGHLYIDEYMWIRDFARLNAVASPMTTRKKFRLTWLSTPSSRQHQGYALWSGEAWRNGSRDRKDIEFPTDDQCRHTGQDCPDGVWRYVIPLADAVAGGIDDIDIDEIRQSYSKSDYDMLYDCKFTDDKTSAFQFDQLLACGTDDSTWQDHDTQAARPFGNNEVWAGFDPARTGDNATFVIISVPKIKDEKYRVLEIRRWNNKSFMYMSEQIKDLFDSYNMTHLGIDITGIGYGVYELIKDYARKKAKPIHYSVENKNRLVLKMIEVVDSKRIQWDQDNKEIVTAFLSVKKTITPSGNAMTYAADRTNEAGHADLFFAIAHAMDNEPLNYRTKSKSTWIT